jgi:hypothetical protein
MTVLCPIPQWPAGLLEVGPPEDRSILLRGEVAIDSARFILMAVRVDPIGLGLDVRSDQSLSIYADYELSQQLDVISDLVDSSSQSTLRLATGLYIMWMIPGNG